MESTRTALRTTLAILIAAIAVGIVGVAVGTRIFVDSDATASSTQFTAPTHRDANIANDERIAASNEPTPNPAEITKIWASDSPPVLAFAAAPEDEHRLGHIAPEQELVIVDVPRGLNLRSGPSIGNTVLSIVPLDSVVTPTGNASGQWIEVDYFGVVGWMVGKFVTEA